MSFIRETITLSLLQSFPEIRWHGHWIWVPEEPIVMGNAFAPDLSQRPEAHGLFRKRPLCIECPSAGSGDS